MKKIKLGLIIALLFGVFARSFAQNSTNSKKQLQISLSTGVYYKNYLGGKTYILPFALTRYNYEYFSKKPTYGFFEGLVYQRNINKKWQWSFGLMYESRKTNLYLPNPDQYVDVDLLSRYEYLNNHYNDDDNKEIILSGYKCINNNIEIPLSFNFRKGHFNISMGVNITLINFCQMTFTYTTYRPDTIFRKGYSKDIKQKVINDTKIPLLFRKNDDAQNNIGFVDVNVSYKLKIDNQTIAPFIGADFGSMLGIYLKAGLKIPIMKK